jgi:tetratricopeptide (TPR) repeat protein
MAANLRIDLYGPANEADRAAMLPKIENSLAMLEQKEGPSARVMRLRGKLLRMQGKRAEAIAALERARQAALRDPAKAGPEMDRWEVIDLLAREYVDTNQLPLARERLEQIMERFPNYDPGRQLLAQTLVKMGDTAAAKPHVERLAQTKPNDPDVIKLKLAVMSTGDAADSNDIRATYSALPETTLAEILDKVNSAMVVKQHDDAQRLLKKAKELAPGDFDMATMGVRVYRVLGDTPAAKTWVDDAIKANPTDERLKVLQKKLMEVAK